MSNLIDLIGQRFGKWTILRRDSNSKNRQAKWLCRCDCGKTKVIRGDTLRSNSSRQCRHCKNTKHGMWGTKLYNLWQSIIQRCEYPNHNSYKHYGGRGIKVCSKWRKDFTAFRKWALENGYKYNLTIDRIDNGGDYRPENCQFITRRENSSKAWRIDGSHGEKYLIAS